MDHWIIYGLMAIAAATYCVVFGFGPVFVAWDCIRRMRRKIAAGRRRKIVAAPCIQEEQVQRNTTPSRN